MTAKRIALLVATLILAASASLAQSERRSAYSYVREVSGEVTVVSALNGEVAARRNLPISAGDEVRTDDPGRAEIALADGSLVHVGGGTQVELLSLHGQQGSDDEVSALSLHDGSIELSVLGSEEGGVPRVDTEDVSVYASQGSRVRVNADPRRGTAVIVRAGSVEVRSRTGSYTVRAGNYLLVQGDEEPEIARGNFSRDRFDQWVADRLQLTYEAPRSASSQYVAEDAVADVAALDGYGTWDYNSSYSSYVWRPTVAVGWTPYSYGSWYYTPVGLTWWSADPWGWYPYHYGNWFFDAGWNSWCWAPGYIYSPAWVYWAYTPGYVGWCPTGWYGPFSPWFNDYYRNWTYPRASMAFAINGNFATRRVDFRGWNFTGASNIGVVNGRTPITPGTRVVDRLGSQIAISSRPIVVSPRAGVGVQQSLREFVREAPRVIERTAGPDASLLEPVLARDRTLPESTLGALRDRTVVSERGHLTGPGARDLAPRGAAIVEHSSPFGSPVQSSTPRIVTDRATGRTTITDRRPGERPDSLRDPGPEQPARSQPRASEPPATSRPDAAWRSKPDRPAAPSGSFNSGRETMARPADPARDSWRAPVNDAVPRSRIAAPAAEDWRLRPDVPPARRVIDGAVPGRRTPEADDGQRLQGLPRGSSREDIPRGVAPRGQMGPSIERTSPAAPYRSAPPVAAPPSRSSPPPAHAAPPPAPAPPSGGSHSGPAQGRSSRSHR